MPVLKVDAFDAWNNLILANVGGGGSGRRKKRDRAGAGADGRPAPTLTAKVRPPGVHGGASGKRARGAAADGDAECAQDTVELVPKGVDSSEGGKHL